MKIELDAVISEYVLETLETISESEKPPIARERAVTAARKALMEVGLIRHSYNAGRSIDEFRATRGLTLQWERDFPELEKIVDPTETIILEIGDKSRTFSDRLTITRDRFATEPGELKADGLSQKAWE
jgi:hypothetical protein